KGKTWRPIFENESTFTIGDIAVAQSNPDIVWVGTGEVLMARSSFAGTGIFKSTDAGTTWQNMGLHDSHHIAKVLIDPKNPDIVYVAAIGHLYTYNQQRGVFKTIDGGKTWQKCLYIDEKTGAIDLVMDPSDSKTIYAATWQRSRKAWGHTTGGPGSGIYKTTDAGKNWKKLTNGFPSGDNIGRIDLDVAPTNPQVVYARHAGQRSEAGVYRSDNAGESFEKVNQQNLASGYDFCLINVSPDDENIIYLPGSNSFVSKDSGQTFTKIEGQLSHMLDHGSQVLHLDTHEWWIDPEDPDRMLMGNDGGLYLTEDRCQSWLHINNLPIGEFYAVSVDNAQPYNIYGGTQDDAALFGPSTYDLSTGGKDPWQHVYIDRWGGGDSYFTYPDPTDHNTIYYEHQFGDLRRKNMNTGSTKSIRPRAPRGEPALRTNWMTPFFISHYNSSTLYNGANKLFKSLDRGDTWTQISDDLTTNPGPDRQGNVPYGTITTIAESHLKKGLLYVGADDGNVQITQNDGSDWTMIKTGLPNKWVTRVVASQHEIGTAYVSLTGYRDDDFTAYLYASSDFGKTWNSITANLPAESINVIREDHRDKNILYVGTDLGIYISLDKGKTWHSLCNNLPTTPVHDIAVHPRENDMIIGTHGRSVFILDIENIIKQ
ncbi:MAG: hypothetical protein GY869_20220, partial [Planctomycetes bacterium]|nr:hypothetical protein [Planctomycetota bacterium]